VIEIEIPPLRDRSEDILPLIYFYLSQYDKQFSKVHTISTEAMEILSSHTWPGNVRELMHTMELLAATVENGEIKLSDLPTTLLREPGIETDPHIPMQGLDDAVENLTRKLIIDAYHMLKSSYKVAAFLNISQSKAHRLIRKYMGPVRLKA
jgi:transcriptional regulator with PAS, ATPase and Fis domain